MNLKALHHYLTTLSPSEEKYRNGYVVGYNIDNKEMHFEKLLDIKCE